ncbi:MAG: hypothetical protein HY529_05535 [Chloroflexi bacterium]|nr:hypothetical protein [Chloroflexota bacterium]
MEEFLPGLVRIMEERLGKFGRPLTTIVVLALAFGAIAWGLNLFWYNVVSPISKFIQTILEVRPFTLEDFVKTVITPLAILIILSIILFILTQILFRKTIIKQAEKSVRMAEEQTGIA